MRIDPEKLNKRADGSLWLVLDASSPIWPAVREVQVVPKTQRWHMAPDWSCGRYGAVPHTRPVSRITALWIMLRARLQRPDKQTRFLTDIEELVLHGHHQAAYNQINRFCEFWPEETNRVLGLWALNAYDSGAHDSAMAIHILSELAGTSHPAMREIYAREKHGEAVISAILEAADATIN